MKFNFESKSIKNKIEEEKVEKEPSFIDNIKDIINRSKDYIKSKGLDLKTGVMLVLAMGTFEVAQGQDGKISDFCNAINDVDSGKFTISNVVDSFYDSYKEKNIDSTYYAYEYSLSSEHSLENSDGLYAGDNKISKPIPVVLNDTVPLGNVEVKSFSVWMDESLNSWKDGNQNIQSNSIHKNVFAIKTNIGNDINIIDKKEKTHVGYGDSKEEAIILAMLDIARSRRVLVTSVINKKMKSENTSNTFSGEEKFIDLNTVESHEILKDVKIIVTEMSNREYRKHYKEDMVSNREVRRYNRGRPKEDHISNKIPNNDSFDHYSAQIIYSE